MNTLSLGYQSCSFFLSVCNDVQEVPSLRGKITSIMCSWKKKHWNYLLSKGRISPILELKACQKKYISDIFVLFFRPLFNCVKFAVCSFLRLLLLSDSHWIITLYFQRLTVEWSQGQKIFWTFTLLPVKAMGHTEGTGRRERFVNNEKPINECSSQLYGGRKAGS